MCTYSKLKKIMCTPPPPRGSMVPLMSQDCRRLAEERSQNVLKVEA